ncbi:ribonucleases P/MRP protein subunit POP1-domain-containing protein [Myxozyma melibiosi]|uniref:Ribonucleases P/MRP protein subunit POP1-domain-containing protein n=1 Tax=Myxozyma melibiosi TaxID=54550 RepID=A0ABR1F2Y3_9ASCO
MSSTDPPKSNSSRKRHLDNDSTSSRAKAFKTANARTIISENINNHLVNGRLNVVNFVESRQYEINQLTSAIAKSKKQQKQQAFQSVPNFLRRRAASHHVKRLPKRLHARARAELESASEPQKPKSRRHPSKFYIRRATALKLARIYKSTRKPVRIRRRRDRASVGTNTFASTRPVADLKFKRRQKNKTWLPTHLWHAKRAHMVTKYGFSIPAHPNDKCFRTIYRKAESSTAGGGVVFDSSYYSTLVLAGGTDSIQKLLYFLTGDNTTCHRLGYTYEGPIYAQAPTEDDKFENFKHDTSLAADHLLGYAHMTSYSLVEDRLQSSFAVLRVHPAIFTRVWTFLLACVHDHDKWVPKKNASKTYPGKKPEKIELRDYRFAVGSIDLFGRDSLQLLKYVLRTPHDYNKDVVKAVEAMIRTGDPRRLPFRSYIAFDVLDPRTWFTPASVAKGSHSDPAQGSEEKYEYAAEYMEQLPLDLFTDVFRIDVVSDTASKLFNFADGKRFLHAPVEHRRVARARAFEQDRRDKHPDSELEVIAKYSRKPVIYVQSYNDRGDVHKWEQKKAKTAGEPGKEQVPEEQATIPLLLHSRADGGVTLLMPWNWVDVFFKELVRPAQTMFGGLDQMKQIMHERGRPFFPDDFPGTPEGRAAEAEYAAERERVWKAKPRSKRIKYSSLKLKNGDKKGEIGNPFACDWGYLMNMCATSSEDIPWRMVEPVLMRKLIRKGEAPEDKFSRALLTVRVVMVGRGTPGATARVYAIPPHEREKWMRFKIDRKYQPKAEDYPPCPRHQFLLGFLTSGGFDLKQGKGTGIGSFSFAHTERYFEINKKNGLYRDRYCLVREVGERQARLAVWSVASDQRLARPPDGRLGAWDD